MWLLPALSRLSAVAARIFYRFELSGPELPRRGPVLLLANHPNSLLDPALVAAAAGRPVRFLAKSTLFSDVWVGWLVRAAGAIPVFRRGEDDLAAEKNVQVFAAVFEQLGHGAAVGIFPEGISHSEPSLTKLKTGAARIALGTYARFRQELPLIPIGLILRDKGAFRSQALAIRGQPILWTDLAERGMEDAASVRELTRRIDAGLRQVTMNLERWEDEPLIQCVEAIWSAELGEVEQHGGQVQRAQAVAEVLADLRRRGEPGWRELARQVTVHRRRLAVLGLQADDLKARVDLAAAAGWTTRRLHLLFPPAAALTLLAAALFCVPYWLTDKLVAAAAPPRDQSSTYKTLVGALLYLLWMVLLAILAGRLWGLWAGLVSLVLLPGVGLVGLWIWERWRGAWTEVRRFFLLRSRRQLWRQLRSEQSDLANRLREVYETWLAERAADTRSGSPG